MAQHPTRNIIILLLSAALMAGTLAASNLDSGHTLIGLGLHEETGRKIYLGGIYLPEGTPRPEDLLQLSSPVSMEYRIVARRTSIRSLLGGMLLQSEVATGLVPSKATTLFADMILSNVKTSLYAGDSLVIEATAAGETLAFLNGHQLARVKDGEVANYLLLGWISENGPTAFFRGALMAEKIDPEMLATLAATRYPDKRAAQVAAWFTPEPVQPEAVQPESVQSEPVQPGPESPSPAATGAVTAIETVTETVQDQQSAPGVGPLSTEAQATAIIDEQTPTTAEQEALAASAKPAAKTTGTATVTAAPATMAAASEPAAGFDSISTDGAAAAMTDDTGDEPATPGLLEIPTDMETASLVPIPLDSQQEDEVLSLGVQEYSRRLAEFHGNVVAMVYREIRYPKRAVRRSLEGRLELDLTLQNDGTMVDVIVSQSSGHKLLDNAAVKAAEKAFKTGALTSVDAVAIAEFGNDDDTMVIPIPVSFKLAE